VTQACQKYLKSNFSLPLCCLWSDWILQVTSRAPSGMMTSPLLKP
jgi:hypothetical protein